MSPQRKWIARREKMQNQEAKKNGGMQSCSIELLTRTTCAMIREELRYKKIFCYVLCLVKKASLAFKTLLVIQR